jgi:6,7-dimethyl-8-ribityllumazine synthase
MAQSVNPENQQLSLDFNAPVTLGVLGNGDQSQVTSLNVYAKSRQLKVQTPPVLERLLQEAQKLRW